MDAKVAGIQQRLRERLSQPVEGADALKGRKAVGFEVVSGIPAGAENTVPEVIAELKRRGHRVAHIMRYGANTVPEPYRANPAQEPYRSDVSLVVTPERVVLNRRLQGEPTLSSLLDQIGEEYDVAVCEGFEYLPIPKILITRKVQEGFNLGLPNIIAYVACKDLDALIPCFSPMDVEGLVDKIERDVMGVEPALRPRLEAEAAQGCNDRAGDAAGV